MEDEYSQEIEEFRYALEMAAASVQLCGFDPSLITTDGYEFDYSLLTDGVTNDT